MKNPITRMRERRKMKKRLKSLRKEMEQLPQLVLQEIRGHPLEKEMYYCEYPDLIIGGRS